MLAHRVRRGQEESGQDGADSHLAQDPHRSEQQHQNDAGKFVCPVVCTLHTAAEQAYMYMCIRVGVTCVSVCVEHHPRTPHPLGPAN